MFYGATQFGPGTVSRGFAMKIARMCGSLQFLVVFTLVGLVASRAAAIAGQYVPRAAIASMGPRPAFAIADFDDDNRLDLANVEGSQLNVG